MCHHGESDLRRSCSYVVILFGPIYFTEVWKNLKKLLVLVYMSSSINVGLVFFLQLESMRSRLDVREASLKEKEKAMLSMSSEHSENSYAVENLKSVMDTKDRELSTLKGRVGGTPLHHFKPWPNGTPNSSQLEPSYKIKTCIGWWTNDTTTASQLARKCSIVWNDRAVT